VGRTARAECLDWTLVRGRRHLQSVLRKYTAHYNRGRPHRGLDLDTPQRVNAKGDAVKRPRTLRRRDIMGGLIHEYGAVA
jgi:putative transposase